MHVLLKVNPWRVHLPCQLARRQNTIADLCVLCPLCPLWSFQPPILRHVFSCAQHVYLHIYILYSILLMEEIRLATGDV